MTKSELIARLADHFPRLVQKDAQVATEIILDAITEALRNGRRIEMRGFGSFSVHQRPARIARNPKTGEPVPVAEKRVPHFKPGAPLLECLQAPAEPDQQRLAA